MRTADWTDSVSVLDRLTAVLDAFGDDDGLGVSEIARRANLPKSTVSRIVTDLVRQRYLDREGFRLWTAQSSEEAEAWLARGTPDVILLDVLMPREDGWDILQQLRTSPATASTPVIICSVLSQPQLALSLGASAVLQKPISREALVMAIRQALPLAGSGATARPAGS